MTRNRGSLEGRASEADCRAGPEQQCSVGNSLRLRAKRACGVKAERSVHVCRGHSGVTSFAACPECSPHCCGVLASHPQPADAVMGLLLLQSHRVWVF